jgi:hypothetical protein
MTFLAPLFLLGALAIALPVVFHLIRRTTRQRTVFSSLMFLVASPPRLTQRSRLENILLLLLRCLVLCLLAFGFARPFLKKAISAEPSSAGGERFLLLIDTSASMRRADLWADARQKAESILHKSSPADHVAIFTFARQVTPLMTFEEWNQAPVGERAALASRKLAEIGPGWSATHVAAALISASETMADTAKLPATGPGHIILISDLQEGSRLEPLQGFEWPRGIDLSVELVKPRHAGNASVQLLAEASDLDPKAPASVRVRVSNSADAKREQFKVGWAAGDGRTFLGTPIAAYVPPGQSRIIAVPLPATGAATDRILLQGDDEDFDNTVFVIPPEPARGKVVYFGNEPEDDAKQPLYFLKRAFQETRRQSVQVQAVRADASWPAVEAEGASLFIVTEALPKPVSEALLAQVTSGKTLLCAPKNAELAPMLASILSSPRLSLEEIKPPNYAMLGEIDFRDPLFAPFADPRFSDFTKIHFWKYRRLEANAIPGAHIIAKFDSGDPAVLEAPIGKGRVIILASGWQPDDSQLAVSTKFVPLLYSILEESGATAPPPAQYLVDDPVRLDSIANKGSRAVTAILGPGGTETRLSAGETTFSKTTLPGIYKVLAADSAPVGAFAVNLDGRESRTAPLPADELERLGAPMSRQAAVAHEVQRKIRLQNDQLESRQKLWRWFIVATLIVLVMETWLAGRTARRVSLASH